LGRTGTKSLVHALRVLGYRKVAHNPRFEDLARLRGGADNGVSIFYKYLDYKFPGSKFVLTIRELDDWLSSLEWVFADASLGHTPRTRDVAIMRRMLMYETVEFDRDKAIAAYERHHSDVRRYFCDRPGDLLEMRIVDGEGWEALCPFLGVEVPDVEFPHANVRRTGAFLR
jgi:hypothetical protein